MTKHELQALMLFQMAIIQSDVTQAQTSGSLDEAQASLESAQRQLSEMRKLLID